MLIIAFQHFQDSHLNSYFKKRLITVPKEITIFHHGRDILGYLPQGVTVSIKNDFFLLHYKIFVKVKVKV